MEDDSQLQLLNTTTVSDDQPPSESVSEFNDFHHLICQYVINRDTEKLKSLLKSDEVSEADVNQSNDAGSTPLHLAVQGSQCQCVSVPLQEGETDSSKARSSESEKLKTTMIRILIEHGADVNETDKFKRTPLHVAARQGNISAVIDLLPSCDIKNIEMKNMDGHNAFHCAILSGSIPIMKLLLNYGNNVANDGKSLDVAASGSDPVIIDFLLVQNKYSEICDPATFKSRLTSALHTAAMCDNEAVIDYLVDNFGLMEERDEYGDTPLMTAIGHGSKCVVDLLLRKGAHIVVKNNYEATVLHYAADFNKDTHILEVILENIKESCPDFVNEVDVFNDTALHEAVRNDELNIVKMLLAQTKIKIDRKNNIGETPFILAARKGFLSVMRSIYDKRRSKTLFSDADENGDTALHHACQQGHMDIVEELTSLGADPTLRNVAKHTPLHLAAKNGKLRVVEFLLEFIQAWSFLFPDFEAVIEFCFAFIEHCVRYQEETSLILASREGQHEVVKTFIEKGANLDAISEDKENCLDIALKQDNELVAEVILRSEKWETALGKKKDAIERMRKLIQNMPEVALIPLNRCAGNKDEEQNKYDYIDDQYEREKGGMCKKLQAHRKWKKNHPLMIALNKGNRDLIDNAVLFSLIKAKWRKAMPFYMFFSLFYMCFLGLLTTYMIKAPKPYHSIYDGSERVYLETNSLTNNVTCRSSDFQTYTKFAVWLFAGSGLLLEFMQMALQHWQYIAFTNLLDWFSYVGSVILVIDIADCGLRTGWQWQIGVVSLLVTWLNVILFFRRLPLLGLYIVMVQKIFASFAKFAITFVLFIITFAISFHLLAGNQVPFSSPFSAIIRTTVMMIGELEYTEIFHNDSYGQELIFRGVTHAVFLIFCFTVPILLMNLLIGMAVTDVQILWEQSQVVRLKMQMDYALDIEVTTSSFLDVKEKIPDKWRQVATKFFNWLEELQRRVERLSTEKDTKRDQESKKKAKMYNDIKYVKGKLSKMCSEDVEDMKEELKRLRRWCKEDFRAELQEIKDKLENKGERRQKVDKDVD